MLISFFFFFFGRIPIISWKLFAFYSCSSVDRIQNFSAFIHSHRVQNSDIKSFCPCSILLQENSMECGGSMSLTPSLTATVLVVLIVTIFPRWWKQAPPPFPPRPVWLRPACKKCLFTLKNLTHQNHLLIDSYIKQKKKIFLVILIF